MLLFNAVTFKPSCLHILHNHLQVIPTTTIILLAVLVEERCYHAARNLQDLGLDFKG